MATEQQMKKKVEQALEALPADKIAEVLDFVLFLKNQSHEEASEAIEGEDSRRFPVRTMPVSHLDRLTGLVEWGGDAFADSERLYDDNL